MTRQVSPVPARGDPRQSTTQRRSAPIGDRPRSRSRCRRVRYLVARSACRRSTGYRRPVAKDEEVDEPRARRLTGPGRPPRRRRCRPRWSSAPRPAVRRRRRVLRRRSASASFAAHPPTPIGCRNASTSPPGGPSAHRRTGTLAGNVVRASRRPSRARTTTTASELDRRKALLSLERKPSVRWRVGVPPSAALREVAFARAVKCPVRSV
jgi:hypothetical protein